MSGENVDSSSAHTRGVRKPIVRRAAASGPRRKFFPKGRKCRFPGCSTALNHLNPGPMCLLHEQPPR